MTPEESKQMFKIALDIAIMKKDIKKLCDLMTHADSDGFSRCAVHTEKLRKLEDNQSTIIKSGFGVGFTIVIIEILRFLFSVGVL